MTDHHCGLTAQRRDEADDVLDDLDLIVGLDGWRLVALAVAAHVRRHDVVTGARQRRKLVAPGIPGLRKPVQQQDQRSLAGFGDIEFDAVGANPSLPDVGPAHAAAASAGPGRISPRASW
jgi:hypothetical protein